MPRRVVGRKEKFTNANLPPGCQDNGAWRRIFLPTYLQYLGSRDAKDPWNLEDHETVSVLQKIWDYTYGQKVPHKITVNGPVFSIVRILILIPVADSLHILRLINVLASGVGALLPLPFPLSKHILTTMIIKLMRIVKNLPDLLSRTGRSCTANFMNVKTMCVYAPSVCPEL